MCNATDHGPRRHSLLCILPPHILRAIARNGTAEQRAAALEALAIDQAMRARRAAAAPAPRLHAGGPAEKGAGACGTEAAAHDLRRGGFATAPRKGRAEGGRRGFAAMPAVDEAYDGLGATFAFYLDACAAQFHRRRRPAARRHRALRTRYDNAFWNGSQMVFGDGDGKLFNRFTIALDVIGHELTHGVTEHEAALVYRGQPGALNESLSDVFGSLVKQHALKQDAAAADWLIGAGLLAKGVKGVALRSMKAPGTAYDDRVLGRIRSPRT